VPQEITYGTALTLVLLVVMVNAVSIVFRSRIRRRRKW
jgi:ABC-type phosphate transport system permease subunit